MWRDPGRRRVNFAASFAFARRAYAALVAENASLREDLERVRLARDEAIATLRQLQAAVLERHHADLHLRTLQRERDLVRAQAVERDPAQPLH
jgi:hypothetical protein